VSEDIPNSDIDIDEIVDDNGEVRRLGSLVSMPGFVSSFQTWESEKPVWDDADIRRVITDPSRTPRRILFGKKWIQNQRSHGSCNGYAASGALSKARWLRGITDALLLSGAFIYSLINGGRDNGSQLEHGLRVIQTDGAPPESLVPWNMIYPRQQPSNAKAEALKRRGLDCYAAQTMQGFRTGIAAGYTGIVAVHAGRNFQRLNQHGIAGVDSGRGNHAVHVDDLVIKNGTELFDHAGSWDLHYGEEGRSYLHRDSFAQTFGTHTFYLIGSTEEKE
jgi:hypothetical protein